MTTLTTAAHLRPLRIDAFGGGGEGDFRASVVVVLHGADTDKLDRMLAGLGSQKPIPHEVLFVNNGAGLDGTGLVNRIDVPGLWIELEHNVGPARARDVAAEHARSDLLVFLDDDAIPDPRFVEEHVRCREEGAIATRGRIVPDRAPSLGRFATHYDLGPSSFPHPLDVEGNTSVDRSSFLAVGGFGPVGWGHEGLILTAKLLRHFERDQVRYDPGPVVAHDYCDNIGDLLRTRARDLRAGRMLTRRRDIPRFGESSTDRSSVDVRRAPARSLAHLDRLVDWGLGFDERVRGRLGLARPRSAVLMYHAVGEEGRWGNVSAERLREDLERLVEDYLVVDVPEALTPWPSERTLVAVTFDDALRSFSTNALPLIEEFGVPVTLYVPIGLLDSGYPEYRSRLDRSPTGDADFNDPDPDGGTAALLSRAELRSVLDSGLVTLGNHTATHPDLAVLEAEHLREEIAGARRELEGEFGIDCDQFSYPYGRWSPEAVEVVERSHALAVTTEHRPVGWRDLPHLVPRLHGHREWWRSLPDPARPRDRDR